MFVTSTLSPSCSMVCGTPVARPAPVYAILSWVSDVSVYVVSDTARMPPAGSAFALAPRRADPDRLGRQPHRHLLEAPDQAVEPRADAVGEGRGFDM